MSRVLFKKVGMTRMFDEKSNIIPVTVLKLEKTLCIEHKTIEKHGYCAEILSSGEKKKANKALEGKSKKQGINLGTIYESRVESVYSNNINEEITLDKILSLYGDKKVKATAKTKGKGFSGTIKRWNFRGLRASHGVGTCERAPGSTGQRTEPGRTFKNKKMAGQYGHEVVSIRNLQIHGVDRDLSLIYIRGAVPGPNRCGVYLTPMKQRIKRGMANGI